MQHPCDLSCFALQSETFSVRAESCSHKSQPQVQAFMLSKSVCCRSLGEPAPMHGWLLGMQMPLKAGALRAVAAANAEDQQDSN